MEPLYTSDRIKIINDSKSTNGESTAAALNSFENIFWIAGGNLNLMVLVRLKTF